ncbi:MAG: multi-sensor hybrid histidine kinase [Caulobacteraceae bacterium]|nr:multi-sensor hybrid histidine kinase [Caulobacteraceae bacterium]
MDRAEAERIAELVDYGVLDTAPEEAFDRLTALAAELFDTPIALMTLIDRDRQWFKSRRGLETCATDERRWSFCARAIEQGPDAVMVVEDAAADPLLCSNPLVVDGPRIRFYAGAVLTTPSGHNLGTVCVIDTKPRATPLPSRLNRLRTLAKIAVDELELRRSNRAARERRRMLDLAETMAGVGHWRIDLAAERMIWSDAVYAIHGLPPGSSAPSFSEGLDYYHPDDRQGVVDKVQQAVATKGSFQFQFRLNRADGELRHVIAKGVCDLDPAGEVMAVIGVFQDVTDQVRNLEDIRRSEAQYRLLAENASDLIMRSDAAGRLTYVSPAAGPITGRRPEDLLGQRWSDLLHAEDAQPIEAAMAAQLAGRGAVPPQPIEYRLVRQDGRTLWLEGRPTFALDAEAGATAGITDVVRDITARKQADEELEQARIEAEAAAAVKSDFLANMSHELRTPLTAVLGFSALIAEGADLSPANRSYLARISNAGEVLLATVNDILDFSKLESGQVDIKPLPVSPAKVAGDMLDLFALQAADKNLDLTAEGLDALPPAAAIDSDRVRQILLNLLGNAVKFTSAGGVRLEAGYDPGRERLSFAVVDSGPGIAAQDADRLFRRFSQVDGSTTRRFGGTGLGLAICKGLVEAMGGEIGVDSTVGSGSRFWFSIPAPLAADVASQAEACAEPSMIPPGCRVLLAEDNHVNRALVRTVLEGLEVELTEACDGLEAVTAAQEAPFDVILMDLRMPRLDGVAAARRIRSEDGPNICVPIIAFSADVTARMQPGLFDALVAKPLSAAALIRALANVLTPQHPAIPETLDVAR